MVAEVRRGTASPLAVVHAGFVETPEALAKPAAQVGFASCKSRTASPLSYPMDVRSGSRPGTHAGSPGVTPAKHRGAAEADQGG